MLLGWALYQSQLYCLYANGSVVLNDVVEKVSVIRFAFLLKLLHS